MLCADYFDFSSWRDDKKNNVLHDLVRYRAIEFGKENKEDNNALFKLLVNKKYQGLLFEKNSLNETPFQMAAKKGGYKCVKQLVEFYFNLKDKSDDGLFHCLQVLCEQPIYYYDASRKAHKHANVELIKLFFVNNPNFRIPAKKFGALIGSFVKHVEDPVILDLLIKHKEPSPPASPNSNPAKKVSKTIGLAAGYAHPEVFERLWQQAVSEKRAVDLGRGRYVLHVAARRGCVRIMETILKTNPEQLNMKDLSGDTSAVCAIKSGNPKALQCLLNHNVDLTKGNSALGYAVLKGDVQSVNLLIQHQQKSGGALTTIATDTLHESVFFSAVAKNVRSLLDLLLKTVNKDPNWQEYSSQHTALSLAYKRKRYDMMASLVNSSLMESEPKDEKGELLLMRAYHDKDIEAFKVLTISPRLNFDFIVNKDNGDWFLHQLIQDYATLLLAESKDDKVIKLQEEFLVALLKTNVKIENINKHKQSAMQKALSLGIQQEYKELIEKLPKSPGVSDSDNSGRSSPDIAREGSPKPERQAVENINPLTIAAYLSNSNMVTELLAVGYDAKVKDALGNSVLSVAITNKNLIIAVALLAKGAVFKDDKEKEKFLTQVIKKDLNGLTALGRAIKLRDDRKIKLLAQYSGGAYDELLRAVNANNESLATTLLGAVGRDNVINFFDDSYDKQDDNLTKYLFSKSDTVVQHLKDKLDWSKLKKLKKMGCSIIIMNFQNCWNLKCIFR